MTSEPLLDVANLAVIFRNRRSETRVLDGISFRMQRETIGIVGESGSGKSTLARAILGVLPEQAKMTGDHLRFDGEDLLSMTLQRRANMLGRRMTMILQDPRYCLNPVMRVGEQVAEGLVRAKGFSRREARDRTLSAFQAVRLRDPAALYRRYPHEISGGMAQRVMISMMLVLGPELLFADEITSALDENTKWAVLETLRELTSDRPMGLVLITHDLELASTFCDRIIVMKSGRIEEDCRSADIRGSINTYTRRMLAAGDFGAAARKVPA